MNKINDILSNLEVELYTYELITDDSKIEHYTSLLDNGEALPINIIKKEKARKLAATQYKYRSMKKLPYNIAVEPVEVTSLSEIEMIQSHSREYGKLPEGITYEKRVDNYGTTRSVYLTVKNGKYYEVFYDFYTRHKKNRDDVILELSAMQTLEAKNQTKLLNDINKYFSAIFIIFIIGAILSFILLLSAIL